MAGTLSIVATPIGHLEDITLRALNVLRTVDLIAAEDTRHTRKLLAHFGIATRTISFHEHNTRARIPLLLRQLQAGQSIALVSDAGTPVLSDPGLELVQACVDKGIAVDPVPGASAPLALAVASGFPMSPWTILGFPPAQSKARKSWLARLLSVPHAVTFFEAPHRIVQTLEELAEISGNRPIVVARELTKVHQTFYRGTVQSVAEAGVDPRGEFTVMLGPVRVEASARLPPADEELRAQLGEITESQGASRRAALRMVAERHGLAVRDVYAAVERAKGSR